MAGQVKIYRDAFGIPHIDGETDEAVVFGFAYAQAEDNFWQIEDSYVLSLGRYSEIHGPKGLNSDMLNRAFEIVPNSKANYSRLEPEPRILCDAFAAGLNYFLAKHPEVKPRLITHFEPWQVVALGRHLTLELCFRYTRLNNNYMLRTYDLIWPAAGSNAWAVAPAKTRSGHAMLLVNPHMPWFGFAQFYEAHLRSGAGWSFTGGTMLGNPMLSMGHNEHLGWALTTNEPDIADLWRETFDDPKHRLNYRYGAGYRTAIEWHETIRVKSAGGLSDRVLAFRKTHHGPVVSKENDQHYLAARIAGLTDTLMLRQTMDLVRARTFEQFKQGLSKQQFLILNILYADRGGNIFYLYNGLVPKRDPRFDWRRPVDGGDPRTEWAGLHAMAELPQLLNPESGYLQNCNSSPFTTTETDNPAPDKFPSYMVEDAQDDKRRAKRSRELLGGMKGVTFEQFQSAAFDTTLYWAEHELPLYATRHEALKKSNPLLARQVEPYLKHLLDWNCRVSLDSTQATLCEAWYAQLYGMSYPAETLQPKYVENPELEFDALLQAAARLIALYGDWRVPWKDVFRMQRQANVRDLLDLSFDDEAPSLPCLGAPGPMGVIFTQYYSPSLRIPLVTNHKKRYGLVGTTYLGVYEFGDKIRGATLLNFGQSGDPKSPHYFDQAPLLSEQKFRPELFYWEDVLAGAKTVYHPGEAPIKRPVPAK